MSQSFGGGSITRVFLEAGVHEVPENVRPVRAGNGGAVVLSNVVQGAHGIHVEVGRLPLGQLDARDSQGPNVDLAVVLT